MPKTEFTVHRDKLQVATSRVFNASRERLWQAYFTPSEIEQWWGPRSLTTKVDKLEAKVGGQWRFVHTDDKGQQYAFHGEYRELVPLEKIVYTFEFEAIPGHITIGTITFEDVGDGKTRLTEVAQFENASDLEGMIQSNMEAGATESYERLAELTDKPA